MGGTENPGGTCVGKVTIARDGRGWGRIIFKARRVEGLRCDWLTTLKPSQFRPFRRLRFFLFSFSVSSF